MPLTKNYLMTWGGGWFENAPKDFVATFQQDVRNVKNEQVVLLAGVLPAEVNHGYHGIGNMRIVSVNGEQIRNLADLVRLSELRNGTPYTVFVSDSGTVLALDKALVASATGDLLKKYQIPADRSADLVR